MPAAAVSVKRANRNYVIEMLAVGALNIGAALAQRWLIAHAPDRPLAIAAALVPAVPVWLMFGVIWRYYRAIDEFQRHKFLVNLAVAFGIGSSLIVSYTCLNKAGFVTLDIAWAWPIFAVSWMFTLVVRGIADVREFKGCR